MDEKKHDIGPAAAIGLLIGIGVFAVGLLSLLNAAMGWHLALRVSGSRTALPRDWDSAIAVTVAGVVIAALTWAGSYLWHKVQTAPSLGVKAALLSTSIIVVTLLGFGARYAALVGTYGSMLAYYCTDGDLDDVRAELAKEPAQETLNEAVSRAAQYNNLPALRLLIAAGADLRAQARFLLDFSRDGFAFTEEVLEQNLQSSDFQADDAVWRAVRGEGDDAQTARVVCRLIALGFSPTPELRRNQKDARTIAAERGLTQTRLALAGRCPQ